MRIQPPWWLCLTALSTRFHTMRSMSCWSPVVSAGARSVSTVSSRRAMAGAASSRASSASADRSSSSRLVTPWSLMARTSSASIMFSARSMHRRTRAAMSSSWLVDLFGLARATSMAVRMTVSGVRSSCEALATNRRCAANARSSRSSMSSNVSASSLSSSRAPVRASRSPRCWSEARRAVSVMARTGRSTRPETNQPRPPDATVITPRPSRENSSKLSRARWRTLCAAASAPAAKACLHARTVPASGCGCLQATCSLASWFLS